VTAMTVEVSADMATVVGCKRDALLCRSHDGKKQDKEKIRAADMRRL
jgi:hypothetical protein